MSNYLFSKMKRRMDKGHFVTNIHFMSLHELLNYCKKRYISLNNVNICKTEIIEYILSRRKQQLKNKLLNNEFQCILPSSLLNMVIDFVDFDENIIEQRCLEIIRCHSNYQNGPLHIYKSVPKGEVIDWFTNNNYNANMIDELSMLSRNQVITIYIGEWKKCRTLSKNLADICQGNLFINTWFRYLYYYNLMNSELMELKFYDNTDDSSNFIQNIINQVTELCEHEPRLEKILYA